jgi:hypothetical protein
VKVDVPKVRVCILVEIQFGTPAVTPPLIAEDHSASYPNPCEHDALASEELVEIETPISTGSKN